MKVVRISTGNTLTHNISQKHESYTASTYGATENLRPDIARLDNAAPYSKGGHRETCFSVRVDAHYKFMFAAGSII